MYTKVSTHLKECIDIQKDNSTIDETKSIIILSRRVRLLFEKIFRLPKGYVEGLNGTTSILL